MNPPTTHSKNGFTLTGRADLLRIWHLHGQAGIEAMAEFAGYLLRKKPEKKRIISRNIYPITIGYEDDSQIEHRFEKTGANMPFWRVKRKKPLKADDVVAVEPDWAQGADDFDSQEAAADHTKSPPSLIPLISWFRFWPFLKKALGRDHPSRQLDIPKIVENVTRLEPLKKLPLKTQFGWDALGCVILDLDERLLPVWRDIHQIRQGIVNLRGQSGLMVYFIENGPLEKFRTLGVNHDPMVAFKLPEPSTPVLIFSDLGCLEPSGRLLQQWLRFGRRLKRAGFEPIVLNPAPPRFWDSRLAQCFSLVWWDRGNRHVRAGRAPIREADDTNAPIEQEEARVKRLLYLLSPAIRVEPKLLRAARMLLPMSAADAATEILAWNHASLGRCLIAFTFAEDVHNLYRAQFNQEFDPDLRKQAEALINAHHAHLAKVIWHEENIDSKRSRTFFQRLFRALRRRQGTLFWEQVGGWVNRVVNRLPSQELLHNDALAACWFLINRRLLKLGKITLPKGLDINRLAWLADAEHAQQRYQLMQRGSKIKITHQDMASLGVDFETGSQIETMMTRRNYLMVVSDREPGLTTMMLNPEKPESIPLPSEGTLTLSTDYDEIILETIQRPAWADKMGRDRYGLFAEFVVKDVSHRMRWIHAGTFMMGSPESEPERYDDELQHEVILTQGFWLGQTTCTQELWQAVMGSNPSEFKGAQKPVENVSWNDCTTFIDKLNDLLPGIDLRLPREAEWEYACRAGTETPFSFGDNITTDQVNYDGKNPYAGGQKGNYPKKTVEVRSLPCNQWGVYEMHGNVWEWCGDLYAKNHLAKKNTLVFKEPNEFRTLRGGGWVSRGQRVRSSSRGKRTSGQHFDFIGFRLARGNQESKKENYK